jgi:undecaprenyl-diphosphatase
MMSGAVRGTAETFSFALAVVLTPAVLGREVLRLLHAAHEAKAAGTPIDLHGAFMASFAGLILSFLSGLGALKWLSNWLETGKWSLFGAYCIFASAVVYYLSTIGF